MRAQKITRRNRIAYSERVSSNAEAVAQVQAVLTRVDAQLDILGTFAALAHFELPPLSLVAVSAHLDQLETVAVTLAANPILTASVLHVGEASATADP